MTSPNPYFPTVDPITRTLREKYVPDRLSSANLTETVQDIVGSMIPGATYNDTLGTISLPSMSVSVGFADVRLGNGDGTTTAQTIPAGAFTTVTLNAEINDANDRFNPTTGLYTCAAAGLYQITARVRVVDGQADGRNIGVGVHTSNVDGPWFEWGVAWLPAEAGGRWATSYSRTALFTAGAQLRLYCYSAGGTFPINTAGMTIVYLGA